MPAPANFAKIFGKSKYKKSLYKDEKTNSNCGSMLAINEPSLQG